MGRCGPATTEVRLAVRDALDGRPAAARAVPTVIACSGGADSLALAAAAVGVRGADGVRAVVVDHGLQVGSPQRARATVEILAGLGVSAAVHTVVVAGPGGPEAAARNARYGALRAARPHPESPVLLGHTLDDQAETVLLGLGRGSGARSLAGMRTWDDPWLRPLLGVRRAVTRAACDELGLRVWDDPHNIDPRFTRVRLRHEVLPLLEDVLAGGVAAALARTAAQLREDAEVLDGVAAGLLAPALDGDDLRTDAVARVAPALRRRVLRAWLTDLGVRGLTDEHLRAADVLAGRGPDRGGVALPGGLELVRARGRLTLRPIRWPPVV